MKTVILNSVMIAAFAAAVLGTVVYAMSIPDVVVSYSTGNCVEVINYADTNYSCENMPTKYNHVWSE